jgi:hypothetical protein
MNPLSLITEPIIDGVNSIAKTFFGSTQERDEQRQAQFTSVQQSFQSEFQAPEKKSWFNALIDAINRLPRPFLTIGVIGLFVWAGVDPVSFVQMMEALTVVPEMLWYIFATVIAFWFSGRILEKAPMRITQKEIDVAKEKAIEIETNRTENAWEDKYEEELKDTSKPLSNKAILEWNARRNNK